MARGLSFGDSTKVLQQYGLSVTCGHPLKSAWSFPVSL